MVLDCIPWCYTILYFNVLYCIAQSMPNDKSNKPAALAAAELFVVVCLFVGFDYKRAVSLSIGVDINTYIHSSLCLFQSSSAIFVRT